MKVAVLSDIHDHIDKLEKVLKQIKNKVDTIIFCGDLCAPGTASRLAEAKAPIYACLGNVDEDQIGMVKKGGNSIKWVALHEEFGQVILGDRKIAFCHYPKLGELLAKTGDYDAVFHGHTHESKNKKVGKTLLLNPGAVCGIQHSRLGVASYAIYNTSSNSAKIIEL